MNATGIIPARYASTRFPGKPLAKIGGKSMIQRVYERASTAGKLDLVVVATDDQRIYDHVKDFGGEVVLTHNRHPSGTDRCAEAAQNIELKSGIVVNIQGDEPFIQPQQIDLLVEMFVKPECQIATLVEELTNPGDLENPNIVTVVHNKRDRALYFSRSPIPFIRNHPKKEWLQHHRFFRHIGIYAYRLPVLKEIVTLPPSSLEMAESLEQLRWLENNYAVFTSLTHYEGVAIDTPEDLEKAEIYLKKNHESS